MKINRSISFLFLIMLLTVSCASKKNVVSSTPTKKNKKNEAVQHSKTNFAYIEAFHRANRLKLQGNNDLAIEAFQHCITLKENDDAVYYALAELYIQKEDQQQALNMILKAYQIDPNNIWYAEELAISYYDTQQFTKAIPIFKKLVEYEPYNMSWLYGYGDCLLQTGKVNDAIGVLNKAESIMGKHPSLSLEKYNLYLSLKKEKEAVDELNRALLEFPKEPQIIATLVDHYFKRGNLDQGINFLKELVQVDPYNGRAHLTLGEIDRQQGHISEAFAHYKSAFACTDIDIDTKMNLLVALQDTPLAGDSQTMDLIDMMVLSHPKDAKSYTIKGDYLMNLEDEEQALENYRKALSFEHNLYAIWNQVMLLEYQNSHWDLLYTDSKECLEYFANVPMAYLMHGVAAVQLYKSTEAIDALKIGKNLLANDKELESEFSSQLGEAYLQLQNMSEGRKYYLQAIEKNPESNVIKNNFAYHLVNTDNPSDEDFRLALRMIDIAVDRSPNQYHYYDTRGWIFFKQGKYHEALVDLQKAHELSPNQAIILEHLGDAYSKLNETEKAVDYWQRALKLGSTSKFLTKKIELKAYIDK